MIFNFHLNDYFIHLNKILIFQSSFLKYGEKEERKSKIRENKSE